LETVVPQNADVVFVSRQRLIGRTNGSSVYLLDLAAAVARAGLTARLVQPSPSLFGRMPVLRLRPEMAVFADHKVRGAVRIGPWLVALSPQIWASAVQGVLAKLARRAGVSFGWLQDRKAPYSIAMPWTDADRAFVRTHVADGSVVIADYIFQSQAFAALGARAGPTAIVMHDLFSQRAEAVSAKGAVDSVVAVSRDDEIAMLASADLVIAIQKAEADFVATHLPGQAVITVPMSFPSLAAPQPGNASEVLFVGSNTEPNVAGLKWFFDHCWPDILRANPAITLSVAGSVAMGLSGVPAPRSVTYLGIVPDLDPIYARAGIIISPLTFGSGLKIKLIEALSLGKAIVATSVTLQGVEDVVDGAVLHHDDAADFAAAVVRLSQDDALRASLGQRAIDVAATQFSAAATQGAFTDWLTQATRSR
jgi:succinoglycan biosynthesis protein ExoO